MGSSLASRIRAQVLYLLIFNDLLVACSELQADFKTNLSSRRIIHGGCKLELYPLSPEYDLVKISLLMTGIMA